MNKFLLFLFFTPLLTFGQRIHPDASYSLPSSLKEISGIQYSNGMIYAINDSGNKAELYVLDTKGNIKKIIPLGNERVKNIDWEDIAIDKEGKLLIGDIGNNAHKKKTLDIHVVDPSVPEWKYSFSIDIKDIKEGNPTEKHFDAEAMTMVNDTLLIFTKDNSDPYKGWTRLYKIPNNQKKNSIEPVDTLCTCLEGYFSCSVTGADYFAPKNWLALLGYQKLWILTDFEGTDVFSSKIITFHFDGLTQRESITFDKNGDIFIAEERTKKIIGGKLHHFPLTKYLEGEYPYTTNQLKDISISRKGSGNYFLNYTSQVEGEYEVVIYDQNGKIIFSFFLPEMNILKEKKKFNFKLKEKINNKHYVRIYKDQRLVYSYQFQKMIYD